MEFEDGLKVILRFPIEIWMLNKKGVIKIFRFTKKVKIITEYPFKGIADLNTKNNYWTEITEMVYFKVQK